MSIFDDREKGFERKFEHDEEISFKVKVRRNKLLGLWAADHLGLKGAEAEAYATGLVEAELGHHGDDALIARLARDFAAKAVAIDEHRLRVELARFAALSRGQMGQSS